MSKVAFCNLIFTVIAGRAKFIGSKYETNLRWILDLGIEFD